MERIGGQIRSNSNSFDLLEVLWSQFKEGSFADWLRTQRDQGASYRTIAKRLEEETGGDVHISYRTIARWVEQADAR